MQTAVLGLGLGLFCCVMAGHSHAFCLVSFSLDSVLCPSWRSTGLSDTSCGVSLMMASGWIKVGARQHSLLHSFLHSFLHSLLHSAWHINMCSLQPSHHSWSRMSATLLCFCCFFPCCALPCVLHTLPFIHPVHSLNCLFIAHQDQSCACCVFLIIFSPSLISFFLPDRGLVQCHTRGHCKACCGALRTPFCPHCHGRVLWRGRQRGAIRIPRVARHWCGYQCTPACDHQT